MACVLAVLLHACLLLMIFFEVLWQKPFASSFPTLDLHPFVVQMHPSVEEGARKKGKGAPSKDHVCPVRFASDEVYVGAFTKERESFLQAVRALIADVWEPEIPSGTGRAVVLLSLSDQGRVEDARFIRMQGGDNFCGFMETFLVRLKKRVFPVLETGHMVRVECEFRVGE